MTNDSDERNIMITLSEWQGHYGLPEDYARDNDLWVDGPYAEYADAEATRQDATAPHEVPQCVADRAASRRVLDTKLAYARWMVKEIERVAGRPF